jgi:hypothetical protein
MPVIAKPVSLAKVARRERGIEAVATDAEAKAEASAAAEADAKTRLQKVKAIGPLASKAQLTQRLSYLFYKI